MFSEHFVFLLVDAQNLEHANLVQFSSVVHAQTQQNRPGTCKTWHHEIHLGAPEFLLPVCSRILSMNNWTELNKVCMFQVLSIYQCRIRDTHFILVYKEWTRSVPTSFFWVPHDSDAFATICLYKGAFRSPSGFKKLVLFEENKNCLENECLAGINLSFLPE